jgi:hypothetical protein
MYLPPNAFVGEASHANRVAVGLLYAFRVALSLPAIGLSSLNLLVSSWLIEIYRQNRFAGMDGAKCFMSCRKTTTSVKKT